MLKRHSVWIAVCAILLGVTPCFAGTWTAMDGEHIAQDHLVWGEVIPAEDMDPAHPRPTHIDWGGGTVLFWPSAQPNPQPGDVGCWLYGSTTWWWGQFRMPSDRVYIQLRGCDSNDGWADIYVDGVYEFTWCTHEKGNVLIEGRDLPRTAHKVEIRTRPYQSPCGDPGDDDVSIDYIAIWPPPFPAVSHWGLVALVLLLLAAAGVLIHRRRAATVS